MQRTVPNNVKLGFAESAGSILLLENNDDDFVVAGCEIEKLKITNPIHRVNSAKQMLEYLDGVGKYADRDLYPSPAVIIVDMSSPDGDGLSAQAIVRSNVKHRDIPLIVIGQRERIHSLRTAVALGANGYLIKPFCGKDLARILLDQGIRLQVPARLE